MLVGRTYQLDVAAVEEGHFFSQDEEAVAALRVPGGTGGGPTSPPSWPAPPARGDPENGLMS